MMAQLQMFGPDSLRSRSAKNWWDRIYRQWAATLDMVVYLDAPKRILKERIYNRGQWHIMKEKNKTEVLEFLINFRMTYVQLMSKLKENYDSPKILRFDTSRKSPDVIANSLVTEFELKNAKSVGLR